MDRIAAVILAAGMSRRMGSPKALLSAGSTTVIQRIVSTAVVAGASPVIVVTGHEPQLIRGALEVQPNVGFVHNANFDKGGMLSSVQTGIAVVVGRSDAFFLMLLDQPFVRPETLVSMAAHRTRSRSRLIMPAFHGDHGHPLLIDSVHIPEIKALGSDATLHTFVQRHRAEIDVLEIDDPGVLTDLDTPEDYKALTDRFAK